MDRGFIRAPRVPFFRILAVLLALGGIVGALKIWRLNLSPLEQLYLDDYRGTSLVILSAKQLRPYAIFVTGQSGHEIAVTDATYEERSPSAHFSTFHWTAPQAAAWFKDHIYNGVSVFDMYRWPILIWFMSSSVLFAGGYMADRARLLKFRDSFRVLRGPVFHRRAKEFRRMVNGDGIRIEVEEPGLIPIPALAKRYPRAPWIKKSYISIEREYEGQHIEVVGETGSGKALANDTPVLTPDGFKTIANLRIGDLVFGQNGDQIKVTGVYPQGIKNAYRILFDDGTDAICCEDHLWTVSNKTQRCRGQSLTIPLQEVIRRMGYAKQSGLAILACDPVKFPVRPLPLDPYVLGVILGNGNCTGIGVRITIPDIQMKNAISPELRTHGVELAISGPSTKMDYRIRQIRTLGLNVPAFEKHIPADYLYGSIDQRLALFQGLMDTDGCAAGRGMVEYSTTSRDLADGFMFLARSLGCVCSFKSGYPTYSHAGEKKTGRLAFRIFVRVPKELRPFRLARKATQFIPRTKFWLIRKIVSIEVVPPCQMTCIRVSASDGLFLIKDLIATHNSTIVKQIVDQAEKNGETAIIFDSEREFIRRYYHSERRDIVANPLDTRFERWDPQDEVDYSSKEQAEATSLAMAESLYAGEIGDRDWFFTNTARLVHQFAMTNYMPSARELATLYTHCDPLLDAIAKGTELEQTLRQNAASQRAGINGTLIQPVFALRQIPEYDPDVPGWSIRRWAETRDRWIFLTSTEDTILALKHLQSLWIDSAIRRLLSMPLRSDLRKVWIIIDELASLQYLPQLLNAMNKARKKDVTVVNGFQGQAQPREIYKGRAETLMSAPYTKIIMRVGEPAAQEWASKIAGTQEVKYITESRSTGKRGHTTFSETVATPRPLFTPSEFPGYENRTGILRYGDHVLKIKAALPRDRPDVAPEFLQKPGTPPVIKTLPDLKELLRMEEEERIRKAEAMAAVVRNASENKLFTPSGKAQEPESGKEKGTPTGILPGRG